MSGLGVSLVDVDSYASPVLKGYQVTGIYMRNWDQTEERGQETLNSSGHPSSSSIGCPEQEWKDVQSVCSLLDIPCRRVSIKSCIHYNPSSKLLVSNFHQFLQVDFSKEYWSSVFESFLEALKLGKTPNPDINCNRFIKFGVFYDRFIKSGSGGGGEFDFMATGHYARITEPKQQLHHDHAHHQLLRAIDKTKDQSYYLSQIPSAVLKSTLFPIGHLLKSQVKQIARDIGLASISEKRESMGICFIGERNFSKFIGKSR